MVQRKTNIDATECAVLTGTGRSAIAVIGLRGQNARSIIERRFAPATHMTLSIGQIRYGNWTGSNPENEAQESVVVTPIGEDRFEIHCHGGSAAIAKIVGDLQAFGAIQIENTDWSEVENLLIGEARQVLAQCLTSRTAAIAMDQVRGALSDWVTGWINTFNEPTTLAAGQTSCSTSPESDAVESLANQARHIAAYGVVTTRLSDPFRVVLVGPPNVGKSSLVNAVVGYDRSITFDQAGTTRDVLHADTVIEGLPIRLMDTAGIRASEEAIEKQGIARAKAAAEAADLVLFVGSPDVPSQLSQDLSGASLTITNKIDLLDPNQAPLPNAIQTNALSGAGIPKLLESIAKIVGRWMPIPGQPVPLTDRQAKRLGEIAESKNHEESMKLLVELRGDR